MNVIPQSLSDPDELRRRIRKEHNAKQRDRYRSVQLALAGHTAPQIAEKIGRSRRFVQRWVYAYRDAGLNAIAATKQTGQPTKLPRHQEKVFLNHLAAEQRILRGRDIAKMLEKHFGVTYTVQGAYDLLHRLGYEPLKPRPVNPKKDPKAEEAFKQAAPLLSKPSETNTPISKSKFGSRTNADLAKRDA
jgi:transposase